MTSNSRLKQQARAYAAEHGVSYVEARRILLTGETGPVRAGVMRILTIQQTQRDDGVLPYPFHVDEDGFVRRQDFWRGNPFRLMGFVSTPDERDNMLHREDWVQDPDAAVGMHPVLADRKGGWATYQGSVETVSEDVVDQPDPRTVTALVTTSDDVSRFTVDVGHLLELLTDAEITTLRDNTWKADPEVGEDMLGWLLASGRSNADHCLLVTEMYDRLDALTETLPEEDLPTVTVQISARLAEKWASDAGQGGRTSSTSKR